MFTLIIILQLIVALGIYNVWFLRANRKTPYRGKNASSLKNEFASYGLPDWSLYLIGTIKVTAATALIIGIWFPIIVPFASGVLGIMMVGAIFMHIKVQDSFKKTMPALDMFILSMLILLLGFYV